MSCRLVIWNINLREKSKVIGSQERPQVTLWHQTNSEATRNICFDFLVNWKPEKLYFHFVCYQDYFVFSICCFICTSIIGCQGLGKQIKTKVISFLASSIFVFGEKCEIIGRNIWSVITCYVLFEKFFSLKNPYIIEHRLCTHKTHTHTHKLKNATSHSIT